MTPTHSKGWIGSRAWAGVPVRLVTAGLMAAATLGGAAGDSLTTGSTAPADLPNPGLALLRVLGALAMVLALFWLGVWAYRKGQRWMLRTGPPRLRVLEARSLGGRQMLYVVAYEQERLLLASSPQGIALLTHLPAETEGRETSETPHPTPGNGSSMPFLQVLTRNFRCR